MALLWLEKMVVPKSKLIDDFWTQNDPGSSITIDHSAFDEFLQRFTFLTEDGVRLVNYGAVTPQDLTLLKGYISELEAVDVTVLSRAEQFAFYLNLYNAVVMRIILEGRLLTSILDVQKHPLDTKRPFHIPTVTLHKRDLSLHMIESGIMRPIWRDPLIHYGLNCGAISCPNISGRAYSKDSLEDDLTAAARAFVNTPRGVEASEGALRLSKIYFWYSSDFGRSDADIIAHISHYATPDLQARLSQHSRIDNYAYDWGLNGRW